MVSAAPRSESLRPNSRARGHHRTHTEPFVLRSAAGGGGERAARPNEPPCPGEPAGAADDGLQIHDRPVRRAGEHSGVLDDESAANALTAPVMVESDVNTSTEVAGVSAVGMIVLALPKNDPEMSPRYVPAMHNRTGDRQLGPRNRMLRVAAA